MRCPPLFLAILICLLLALICMPLMAQSNLSISAQQPRATAASQRIPTQFDGLEPRTQDLFRKTVSYDSGAGSTDSPAVGDLNGNGIADLVVENACQSASKYLSCTNAATEVSVLLGVGGGNFWPAVSYGAGGYSYPGDNGWSQPLDAGKKCGTSTYLSTSGSPSLITDTVTFTAQAIAYDYCHGQQITCDDGGVNFYDDRVLIGTSHVQNCMAVFYTDSLTAGKHRIVATFVPGMGWHESSAKLTQVVNKWPVTVSLSSDPNPSSHRQNVTFTAAVVSQLGGLTGEIKFMNGTRKIGIVAVDENGMATLTTANLRVGTDAITAEYLGDNYDAVGTSDVLNQVVQP